MQPVLGRECLYLSREEVVRVGVTMAETIAAVTEAYTEKGQGLTQMPAKTALHPLNEDAFIHAMPAYVPGSKGAGIKWVSGYPDNPSKHGLPYITGLLILNDPATGVPTAVMDCTWITAKRTGAVSGMAAKRLARPDSTVAAILGTGVQARTQLEALATAMPELRAAYLYDAIPSAVDRFINDMRAVVQGVALKGVASAEAAVRPADIVVSAGPILKRPNPVVQAEWLKEGALGLPIDFDSMWSGAALSLGNKYYVDDLGQYKHYQGLGYFNEAPAVLGDLGDLLTGRVPGRTSPTEPIISMNLGTAICDMALAARIYQRALERNIGTLLPL